MDHRELAVAANNRTWELLGNDARTDADTREMVHVAHASLWHWLQCGDVENEQRGEWLVSHVYAVIGRAEPAVFHALRCLEITEAAGLQGFDRAYAYEAMGRALALANDETAAEWRARAEAAGAEIADPEDRAIFEADFKS
jgi:hypothetical protein